MPAWRWSLPGGGTSGTSPLLAEGRRGRPVPLTRRADPHLGYPGRVPGRLKLWIALAIAGIWPAQALAAVPPGNTTDPLQRAALLSFGSIYRIETVVSVRSLRTASGRSYPLGHLHDVTLLGTAFVVAPTGILVTDAHVAAPFGQSLAVAAAPLALAQVGEFGTEAAYENWVVQNNVEPVGTKVVTTHVWRATASPGVNASPVPAHLIPNTVEDGPDVALLQLDGSPNLPALPLNYGETLGTPIVTIGYGTGTTLTLGLPTTLVPAIKTGALGETGKTKAAPNQLVTYVSAPISHGDSGAPVIDAYPTAAVHGLVRFQDGNGGLIEPSQPILDLLDALHVTPTTGPVYTAFATGMKDMWAGNYVGAEAAFADTLAADPTHPLAAQEQRLAANLARTKPAVGRPAWWRALFAGIALIAGIAALACLWRLRRLARLRGEQDDPAAHVPPAQ